MKITQTYARTKCKIMNENFEQQVATQEAQAEEINSAIHQMKMLLREYSNELMTVQEIGSKFAYILDTNSYLVG